MSGILRVNPKALSLLGGLVGRLHVVAIFGPKGTGKSFLMNQLAGELSLGEGECPPFPVSLSRLSAGDCLVKACIAPLRRLWPLTWNIASVSAPSGEAR